MKKVENYWPRAAYPKAIQEQDGPEGETWQGFSTGEGSGCAI